MSKYPPAVNRALYAHSRSVARTHSTCASFARYEAYKAIWTSAHPDLTPEQYSAAMRRLAKECGV